MMITSDITVGQLATTHPLATRVFARHDIDYCCGGGHPLGEACKQKGLNTEVVIEEIQKEISSTESPERSWEDAPLPMLIEYIITTYHRALHEELPRLEAMAQKVVDVHHDKAPEMLTGILTTYLGLKAELEQHMQKEEQVLFPMITQGQGFMASGPIAVMNQEHEAAGAALARLRELTNGYTVPDEACNTWRALWHGLAALEESLHQHIHLENNILFPRSLES